MNGIRKHLEQIEARMLREQAARHALAGRVSRHARLAAAARIMSGPPRTEAHARVHALFARAAARREREVQDLL